MTTYFGIGLGRPPGQGWVRLPEEPESTGKSPIAALRAKSKDKNKNNEDLTEWAATTAGDLLGPGPDPARKAQYAETLADLAAGARKRDVRLGYAWIPNDVGAVVAKIDISVIHTTREHPELTLDLLERRFAGRDAATLELEVSRTELPVGPAVRLRREWGSADSPADAVVSVTYLVRPPAIRNAISYSMYWVLVDDDPLLTEIADSTAETLSITT